MTFLALLFHLVVWAAPPVALVLGSPTRRKSAYGLFPLALVSQGFALGVFSAVSHPALAPGWGKLFLVEIFATAVTWALVRAVENRMTRLSGGAFTGKALLLCGLGAALATADLVAIFSGQGFPVEKGRWFHSGETYFRPPMNNDLTRHVVVVNSLLRRAQSTPFLPASHYSYQLFWHHLAALSTAPLAAWWAPVTNYPLVMGHVAAVALVFFFLLLWALHSRRPSLFQSRWMALGLGVLVLGHADLFHFLFSVLTTGRPGIEADWSAEGQPFRNFSPKLMGLTAPQHALFFLFFLAYVQRRRWVRGPKSEWLALPCFVVSPILGLFVFPLWWLGDLVRGYRGPGPAARKAALYSAVAAAGVLAYTLVLRANPIDLVSRPGANSTSFFAFRFWSFVFLPVLWAGSAGVLGLLAPFAFRRSRWAWPFLALLAFGLPFYAFVVTSAEISRHFSMVVSVLCALFLIRVIPRRDVPWRRALAMAALATLPLHAYFIHCYLGKPSSLDTSIPWQDYYGINKAIVEKIPGQPVLAAVQPGNGGIGLEKPIPMEVTTSFSVPYHTSAHVKVTEEQMRIFRRIMRSGETARPWARRDRQAPA